MARLTLPRPRRSGFLVSIGLYASGCVVAGIVAYVLGNAWMPVLFAAGAAVILHAWRGTPWPDSWSRWLSPAAILLLVCVLDRAFYIADYFVTGTQFAVWPFYVTSPQLALFKGEVIAILGTVIAVLGWRAAGGLRISPSAIMTQPRRNARVMLVLYIISLAGMLAADRIPTLAIRLGQLLPTMLTMGLVSTFLLPMTHLRRDWQRLIATVVLGVPFVVLASRTGMKESIIFAFVPSALMAWRCARFRIVRAGMVVSALLVLALITSYVNFYRANVWVPESHGLAPMSGSVPEAYLDKVKVDGLAPTIATGLTFFLQRADASYAHGWAVSIADEQAHHPRLVFAPMAYVFVPRVLWPDKPVIMTGWEYSGIVFGEQYIAWSTSSTAAGFYPALYLGGGWFAMVLGALIAGALLAWMTRVARRFGGDLTAGMYIFSMLPFMLRMNANWPYGVLSGPIIILLYVLVVVGFARVASRIVIRTRRNPAAA